MRFKQFYFFRLTQIHFHSFKPLKIELNEYFDKKTYFMSYWMKWSEAE